MIKRFFSFLFEGKSAFNLLSCCLWGGLALRYIGGFIRKFTGIESITSDNFTVLVIIISLLFSLPAVIRKLQVRDYFFYFTCVAIYLLQFLFYPENTDTLELFAYKCCLTVFPFYFYGKFLDMEKMETPFYYISYFTLLLDILYYLVYGMGSGSVSSDDYNMGAAYAILPHALYIVWMAFRRPTIFSIGGSVASFLLLLGFGTRGPVLSYLLPIVCYVFLLYQGKYAKQLKITIATLLVVVVLLLIPLAMYLQDLFEQLDISVRIFDKILDEELENDSGRSELIFILHRAFQSDPRIFGFGLFGSYNFIGGYPHNIFYELVFSFGYVVGVILIIVMLYHFYSGFRNATLSIEKEFIFLFVTMELVHLFFSYTFLHETWFFLLLGYCSQMKHKISITQNYRL